MLIGTESRGTSESSLVKYNEHQPATFVQCVRVEAPSRVAGFVGKPLNQLVLSTVNQLVLPI